MKLKCPNLLKPVGTMIQENYWSFYLSQPFRIIRFNMRLAVKHNKSPKYLYRVQSMHEQRTHSVRSAKHFEKYLGHCHWCMYKFAWTFFLLAISKPIYLKKAIFFDIFNGTALQTSKVPGLINKLWKQEIFLYALVSFDHFETQKSYDIQS